MNYAYLESQFPKYFTVSESFDISDPISNKKISFTAIGSGTDGTRSTDDPPYSIYYANDISYSVEHIVDLMNSHLDCSFSIHDDGYITKLRMFELFPAFRTNGDLQLGENTYNNGYYVGSTNWGFRDYELASSRYLEAVGYWNNGNYEGFRLKNMSNSSIPFFVNSNGNVGIGTSVPKNRLDVEGAVAIGSSYSGSQTAPSNGLCVEGNVGIGLSNPSHKLDVSGNIQITGTGNQMSINSTESYAYFTGTSSNSVSGL